MAEILKAESYTSVMKTAHEDVYTLFIEAEVVSDGGEGSVINVLGDGASVGAYNLSVASDIYTLTFQSPAGFHGVREYFNTNLPIYPHWSFLGAPTIQLVYPDAEVAGLVAIPQICDMNIHQFGVLPYISFAFLKRTGTEVPVLEAVTAPIGSKIQITFHYTTSDKK